MSQNKKHKWKVCSCCGGKRAAFLKEESHKREAKQRENQQEQERTDSFWSRLAHGRGKQ